MAVQLSTYVGTLKRQVIPLGGTEPAGVSTSQWTNYLIDAFWQARLDGLLEGYTVDVAGNVTPLEDGGDELDTKWVALITLYAAITILSNQILNTKSRFAAKAGPVEFEQETSSTMLAEMLKQLRATKTQILDEVGELLETPTFYLDAYSVRAFDSIAYWGSPELT